MKFWMPARLLCLGIGWLIPVTGSAQRLPGTSPVLRVSVFDDANVGTAELRRAERVASRIFRRANIEVIWIECSRDRVEKASLNACTDVSYPAHLHLRVAARSHGVKESVLGMSFQSGDGRGCCADLFYEPTLRLETESHVAGAIILGHAMAHELGHLLLGNNSHSRHGLMEAHWEPSDLAQAAKGNLLFSSEESMRMRSQFTRDDSSQLAALVQTQPGAHDDAPLVADKGN